MRSSIREQKLHQQHQHQHHQQELVHSQYWDVKYKNSRHRTLSRYPLQEHQLKPIENTSTAISAFSSQGALPYILDAEQKHNKSNLGCSLARAKCHESFKLIANTTTATCYRKLIQQVQCDKHDEFSSSCQHVWPATTSTDHYGYWHVVQAYMFCNTRLQREVRWVQDCHYEPWLLRPTPAAWPSPWHQSLTSLPFQAWQ